MKLDPNKYCVVYEQNLIWAVIHDLLAHPLMALTLYKVEMFIEFHDYTSAKAWIRDASSTELSGTQRTMQEIDQENAKILSGML